MTGTIKAINILLIILLLSGCKTTQPTSDSPTGVQNIPNIIKALEALGSVGKKEVDKEEKK